MILVEKDETLRDLAEQSLQLEKNKNLAKRVSVLNADVLAKGEQRHKAGLNSQIANHVVINPPFYHGSDVSSSPSTPKAEAHILDQTGLEPWIKTATDILTFGGELTLIYRADGLCEVLSSMNSRFGTITILPIFSREGMKANRIIIRGIRGSRGPTEIRRGIVMHQSNDNKYTPFVESILRQGDCIDLNAV